MRAMERRILPFLLAAAALAGCAKGDGADRRRLTERERDSTIAASPLPGSGTVGRAMELADSASARRAQPIPDAP